MAACTSGARLIEVEHCKMVIEGRLQRVLVSLWILLQLHAGFSFFLSCFCFFFALFVCYLEGREF